MPASGAEGPYSSLLLSNGVLYGTTGQAGAYGDGEVFAESITGGTPTILASFNGTDGAQPYDARLTISGNTLYGTTTQGGAYNDGVLFSLPITGGTPNVMMTFQSGTNFVRPTGGLLLINNTLYGTAIDDIDAVQGIGVAGPGAIYSLPISGGTPSIVAYGSQGSNFIPYGDLTLSAGNLYAAGSNGSNGDGVILSAPLGGGTISVLASLNGTDGEIPWGDLVVNGNSVYGTAEEGGANDAGTVFSVPVTGGSPAILCNLPAAAGDLGPLGGVVLVGDDLIGTSLAGTSYPTFYDGIVYSVPVLGGTATILGGFLNNTNPGAAPVGTLVADASGNLYGITEVGGSNNTGTIFELAVPEPTSIGLLAIGSLALLRRSRRFTADNPRA